MTEKLLYIRKSGNGFICISKPEINGDDKLALFLEEMANRIRRNKMPIIGFADVGKADKVTSGEYKKK